MKSYLLIFLKGLAMGAADVIPGVSGGTIAFITGIYDTLLQSINRIKPSLISKLKNEGIKEVWNHINGWFLVSLFAGIGVSVLSLSKVLQVLLKNHAIPLWAFFFGLILASIIYLYRQIEKVDFKAIFGMLIGAVVVVLISRIPAQPDATNLLYVFFCGMIAICAMILPGISGSFILLVLGVYSTVFIHALAEFDLVILGVFGLGAITGLLSFSKVLSYILEKFHHTTFAVLIGFLIGSLYKVWPWKHIDKIFVKHPGESNEKVVNLMETNVLPTNYDVMIREGEKIVGYQPADGRIVEAIIFLIIGFSIIFTIEGISNRLKKS
jgi:putative membrane protein